MISRTPLPDLGRYPAGVTAVLNPGSGSQNQHELTTTLKTAFAEHGVEIDVRLARRPDDIFRYAEQAANAGRNLVVAGGGDGTISAVASVLAGTQTALGILPCGTFNYFARLLGVPLDSGDAVRAMIDGEVATVSLGEVNGRVFLNNASIGLYPALLREREELYRRWGRSRLLAYVSATLGIFRPRPYLEIDVSIEGKLKRFRTPMIFAAHNPHQIEDFGMAGAACIEAGKLAYYVLPPAGRLGLLKIGWRMMRRKLTPAADFHLLCSDEIRVHTRARSLSVAYDGELVRMKSPLTFRLKPDALRVVVPRSGERKQDAA